MTQITDKPHEEAFFFENQGERLFGILHTPADPSKGDGIVFCDPYGEEKHFARRVLANFARRVCAEGFHVLRFDYRGNGDSQGELEAVTPASQLSDIKRA